MKSIKYQSEQLNCEISIDYFISKPYKDKDMEAFYFLDGQNAFLDKSATYGRSIRALKHLDKAKLNYIAIAIHSPNKDQERLNMYSPFLIEKSYLENFNNNPLICQKFISELENIIIPSITTKYNVSRHHLIGSSLAASLAIYINSISKTFKSMCILSNSNFIFDKEMYKHLDNHKISKSEIYLGVGTNEVSDSLYSSKMYLEAFDKYKNYLTLINAKFIAKKIKFGKHNEKSWEKQFAVYLKTIIIKNSKNK